MHDIIVFSLIILTLFRILGLGISIDFYFRTKDSIFKIFGLGWFLWGCAGILPLIANNGNNQFLSEFLLVYNILLSTLGILILCWGLTSYYFVISWKYVISLSITILLVTHLLFLIINFKFAVSFTSLISQIMWISAVLLPLIKRKIFIKRVDKQIRYNFYSVAIIAMLYIPIGLIIYLQGDNYGLYNSDNVILITLNYGYLLFITVLLNVLSLHLEYRVSLAKKDELKDKYSHNLGNAMQSIYTSLNLLDLQNLNQDDKNTVKRTLEAKLKEAEKLLREIREL